MSAALLRVNDLQILAVRGLRRSLYKVQGLAVHAAPDTGDRGHGAEGVLGGDRFRNSQIFSRDPLRIRQSEGPDHAEVAPLRLLHRFQRNLAEGYRAHDLLLHDDRPGEAQDKCLGLQGGLVPGIRRLRNRRLLDSLAFRNNQKSSSSRH